MLKTHEKFHSANGKRLILIVDDEQINRELLSMVLEEEYETIHAADGETALQIIREKSDTLSLILLDLLMPGLHGLDLIKILKNDQDLKNIPVIVLTADQEAEVTSLQLGAADFIPKPYPKQEVILTRVMRAIELSEDRDIIQSTERDHLTALYNREYFYRYAQQFDQHHKDMDMDAIVVDVHHFRMINERYGRGYGDDVLCRIGEKLREMVRESGGIVCRREADTFLVYCPHREDYEAILESATIGLTESNEAANRVRLRMGVYAHADKNLEMERRFDRAKMASDMIRSNYIRSIAMYDNKLHESEIYAEQLLEDFDEALAQKQFVVFFQPKFDICPESPVLASAEALVRWRHPKLGMISPGVFIPLFEENGLIQKLDLFVWRETASRIRDWKERLGSVVPVSVNVSRVDMYDPNLIDVFENLLQEFELTPRELLLEITESAYTQDSAQIISTVNRLRDIGFRIEMDDFGTGYSSLNMISSLPIDALKLDMKFIRNAFRDGRDTRLIEVIIDIADYLSVPVIAEGVESREQLEALRMMGCDLVQGFYFSRPVPAEEYEGFIEKKKQQEEEQARQGIRKDISGETSERAVSASIVHALTSGFEAIYYVDTATGQYVQFSAQGRYEDLQIERSGRDFFGDTQRNIPRTVYWEDQERVSLCMQREALLAQLMGGHSFSMTYRLMLDGKPAFYNLRAVKARAGDNDHIVIGISNVEDQITEVHGGNKSEEQNKEFFSIAQALSSDFESIYYVDSETNAYAEFTAQGAYEDLQIELSGSDFFAECQKNLPKVVFPDDQSQVSLALRKENLMKVLDDQASFTLVYRLMIDGTPAYYQLKAVRTGDARHLVIGVSNVDTQIGRERAYEVSRKNSMTYSRIAQALAKDYFSIYYVDLDTGHFVEFSSDEAYGDLGIEKGGDDFFTLCKKNILQVIYPGDQAKILEAFTREKLIKELNESGTFTLHYRLMIENRPTHVSLKATRMADDDSHVVIGVNNIDAQIRREEEYEHSRRESMTYARIAQALSMDYFSIYVVNTETDEFIEYSSNRDYKELKVEQSGVDFFADCRRNIMRLVYPEDRDRALSIWDKSRLMPELEEGNTFSAAYRLMFDGKPVYINCKVIRMTDSDEDRKYIIVGVSNVDAQMKRERELNTAREKANRDALTGVKSKHAYMEAAASANTEIGTKTARPFAVAVCDVNGLKKVNDTLGHQAGDRLILDATHTICEIFKHSPVYRVGGDEFVVILRGADYENRQALMEEMSGQNRRSGETGGAVIACGLSEWKAGTDQSFERVFDRADAAMYENKTALKNGAV